jgi:hypothetical protein
MKKLNKIIVTLIIILLLAVIGGGTFLYVNDRRNSDKKISELENKIKKQEIYNEINELNNSNANLIILIEYRQTDSLRLTYYFYDNKIVELKYQNSGALPGGEIKEYNDITNYYFDKKIDLSELENFLSNFTKEKEESVQTCIKVTEHNGNTYYINDRAVSNSGDIKFASSEISSKILEIESKATKNINNSENSNSNINN